MGPIYGTQTVSVPPPPIGIGPHIRLFAAPAPPVPPAPGTGIPWGSGAFQGFARPAIPPVPASMMTPQVKLAIILIILYHASFNNPWKDNKILTNLKAFNVAKMMISVFDRVENIVDKGENAC